MGTMIAEHPHIARERERAVALMRTRNIRPARLAEQLQAGRGMRDICTEYRIRSRDLQFLIDRWPIGRYSGYSG